MSFHGKRYFVLFIDDDTDLFIGYFLCSLTETKDAYNKLRSKIHTHFNKRIRYFHADNHGTYTSDEMMKIFEGDGTIATFRAPHDPNGNAKAERGIRTVTEKARTLLHSSGLPLNMWQAAIQHAIWLHNRTLSRKHPEKTPHELFWGVRPDIRYFHPFGCLSYALVPKENNPTTFEPRARACVFLGISPHHDAWLLFDIEKRSEIITRDVSFFDHIYPLRKDKDQPFQQQQKESLLEEKKKEDEDGESDPLLNSYNLRSRTTTTPSTPPTPPTPPPTPPPTTTTTPSPPPTPLPTTTTTPSPPSPPSTPPRGDDDPEPPGTPTLSLFCETLSELLDVKHLADPEVIRDLILTAQEEVDADPRTIFEAFNGPDGAKWKEALRKEYQGIDRLKVYRRPTPSEFEKSKKEKIFDNHNVLKRKRDEFGRVDRHKARNVLEGQHMKKGVHFDETFSPCAGLKVIRLIAAIATHMGWTISHADVPNAYLHGRTNRLIFTRVPIFWNELIGPELGEDGDIVVLDGTIYSAPHAGRSWNIVLDTDLKGLGFVVLCVEPALYFHITFKTIIAAYVDDLFITGGNMEHRQSVREHLQKRFQIREDEILKYALGIRFQYLDNGDLFLSQTAYIDQITADFKETRTRFIPMQQNIQPTAQQCPQDDHQKEEMSKVPYRKYLGKLLYLSLGSRPDIAFAVSALSRFANDPGKPHWELMKKLIGYVKFTREMGILYKKDNKPLELHGMSDAAFNRSYCHRSWLGHAVGVNGSFWTWKSHVSKCYADSPPMAETLAAHQCLHTILWATHLFNHLQIPINKPIVLSTDSKITMDIMKEPRASMKSRHFEPKLFSLMEKQLDKTITLQYVDTENIAADIFTKALGRPAFEKHRLALGVQENPLKEKKEKEKEEGRKGGM